jgi:hypothetical protein
LFTAKIANISKVRGNKAKKWRQKYFIRHFFAPIFLPFFFLRDLRVPRGESFLLSGGSLIVFVLYRYEYDSRSRCFAPCPRAARIAIARVGLFGASTVHALRALPADLPDLRRHETGTK